MSMHRSRPRGRTRSALTALLLVLLGLLAVTGNALAGSLNLAWDGVVGASGYRLAYGTASGNYSASLDAGSQTAATVAGLTEGARYFFAVQAYNATATSAYSNEVNALVPTTTTTPVPSFTANGSTATSVSVAPGQTVSLVDTSTGTVTSRSWNLGDGTSAISPTVVKTYPTTGTRTVTLTVTGAGVTPTASKTINVTATTPAPVAAFSGSPVSGSAPLAVKFTDASTGSITGWSWSFGNGTTNATQSPTVTYAAAGTYTVALTVSGPGGSNTATKTGYVTVSAAAGGGTVSTTGLVAAYGFDETSGTQALDTSGRGNHGTLSNVTRTTQAKFGQALSFNGTSSLVTVPDSASLDLTSAMTLAAWVYPTSWASGWKSLIMKERTGGLAYALSANSDTGQPSGTVRIASADRSLSAGNHLATNTWTHLATTYDGATQRLFVNGTQVGSRAQTGSLEVSANPLRIGGNTVWAGQFFQGLIDEVRLYSRALSQSEVAAVAQEPVVPSAAPLPPASVCATPCSLWDNATTPGIAAKADYSAVEVGVKFRSEVAGQVTGVRFYKGTGNTGTHVGRLWSSTGQLLAQATFTSESASGWQQVSFATPVAIQANTTYVVSYYAPLGRYAYNEGFFATAYTKGPLRAPSTTEATGNGVYRYGAGGGFPNSTYRSANYWVDVVFKTP